MSEGRATSTKDHINCSVWLPTDLYHQVVEKQQLAPAKVSFSRMLVILIERGLQKEAKRVTTHIAP